MWSYFNSMHVCNTCGVKVLLAQHKSDHEKCLRDTLPFLEARLGLHLHIQQYKTQRRASRPRRLDQDDMFSLCR